MAKNNEAKIKFTGDTEELNAQIKNANSTLAALRSGLKLNEAEFKNTGDTVEYYKNKQNLLQKEIEENRKKQEALNQKLELAKSVFGENSLEVQELSTKLNRAKTEEQSLITQISQCENEMQQQAVAAQKEQTALEQLNTEISEQKSKLEALKTEYKNIVLEQGSSADEAQNLKSKINQLNSELEQNEQKLSDIDDEFKKVDNAAEKAGQSVENSANGGWTTAKQIFADLAANAIQQCVEKLKEVAKEMVNLGMDFTSSMSNVQALSGATEDELASLEKTARDLGSSTVFSASQVADGFSYMALAGWDTTEMLDGIEGVLNLAAAADMDLAEASDIVTDYLTAFGLSAEDSGGFVDQMAFAMANSNTNVTQLGEAYKNCAATASSMGYSVEDTTAALMTMANAGVKGGEAGTGLSSIMTRLATDTKKCASELAGYGVQVYDSKGNMNDLSSILNGCAEVWGTLTDQEQANLAKTIAGTSQFSKFQTVMNGLSESAAESGSSFNDYTKALENVKNASAEGESAASDMADTMQNNLGGDVKELNSAFEEFQLKVYDCVENPLRDIVSYVTNSIIPVMTEAFNWMQEHKTMLGIIAGVILTVVTVMGIMHGVIALGTALKAAEVTSISGLVAAHIAETASLGPLIAAKWSAAAAGMAALAPYILIVAAIAAVIAIIVVCVKHWDEIKAKVTEVTDNIKNILGTMFDYIDSYVFEPIRNGWYNFCQIVINVWENIKNAISFAFQLIANIISAAFQIITLPFRFIWENCKEYVFAVFDAIRDFINNAINKIKEIITTVLNAIKTIWNTVWAAVKNFLMPIINSIKDFISTAFNAIKNIISTVVNTVKTVISTVFNAIRNVISNIINGIKNTITNVFNAIKNAISVPLNAVKSTVSNIFDAIRDKIDSVISKAKDIVQKGLDAIKGFFDKLKLKFPDLKLPHFKVDGEFSFNPPKVPKLGIEWRAKGVVFKKPAILNSTNGLQGVGEAGAEAVAPIHVLQSYVQESVDTSLASYMWIDYDLLGLKVALACAKMNIAVDVDGRVFGRVVRSVI